MELLKSKQTIEEKSELFDRLPDELVEIILNKLDEALNLFRFGATCKRFFQLPSQIRSLSTSLPLSVLNSEDSLLLLLLANCPYDSSLRILWPLNQFFTKPSFVGIEFRHAYFVLVFCRLCFSPSGFLSVRNRGYISNSRILERFSSLDSLVVTLETLVFRYYGEDHPCWFLWDAELYDNAKPKGYVAVVLGNPIQPDTDEGNIGFDGSKMEGLYNVLVRHILFHRATAKLLLSKGCTKLRSVVTKDADKRGKLRFHRCHEQSSVDKTGPIESLEELWLSERRLRLKFCYAPTLLKLNNSVQISDAAFLFITWVEDDDTTDIDDLIKACLGFGQTGGEDDDRKELKEIAMKILTHEKSTV